MAGPIRLGDDARTALRPASRARVTGGFWAERRRVNAEVSVPQGPGHLEEAGNLHNLRLAAGAVDGEFIGGYPFQDSDVYKWLEAASWQLADGPDADLESHVDDIIALVAAAQRDDGYVQTYYQTHAEKKPWTELAWGHELYCAGHLIQAAVAHSRATGGTSLLDVAVRFADHVDATFGPGKPIDGVCGHPEVETALVELYRETGEIRYLRLAEYFVDRRGHGLLAAGDHRMPRIYWQDHVPVREARTVTGHAVRQLYLLAGATDIASETGETELREAMTRLWDDMAATKTYITGGVGSRHDMESFGDAYELPPDVAYCETCAAVASIHWGWRMALLTGEAKYSDLVERTLYNGFLSGVSLDGARWLYVNPLQVRDGYSEAHPDSSARRREWFGCACCPPNVMRLLASLAHYCSSVDGDGLRLHQYMDGGYAGGAFAVEVATEYPWQGPVRVTVTESPDEEWTLSLRVPQWCDYYLVRIGDEFANTRAEDGWLRLRRRWAVGDTVSLGLGMAARFTAPDRRVDAVRGCVAIERGPLVYCVEQVDAGVGLDAVAVDVAAGLREEARDGLLGGVRVVTARGRTADGAAPSWPYGVDGPAEDGEPVTLPAVPYYAWANREAGAMRVWLPVK